MSYLAASKTIEGPSNDAGDRIRPKCTPGQESVLAVLRRHPAGLTADEIAERMGRSLMFTRPRVSELRKDGLVENTGVRRANASGMTADVVRIKRENVS